jgi:hypothetical protein
LLNKAAEVSLPEDGQVVPLPHRVLLQLIGDAAHVDDGGSQRGVGTGGVLRISGLLLDHMDEEWLGQGRRWVE